MEAVMLRKVDKIRKNLVKRSRSDGSARSGNWGHLGRPGEKGGSKPGGGGAFRIRNTVKNTYTSQAQMRRDTKAAYKAAMASGSPKAVARMQRRMKRINMNVKTSDVKNAGKKGYRLVKNIDLKASQNILKDPKRGKRARESSVGKYSGTRSAIRYAFPNRTTRGGSGKKGGKTAEKKSKV